jgi:hypothetical protein
LIDLEPGEPFCDGGVLGHISIVTRIGYVPATLGSTVLERNVVVLHGTALCANRC